MSQTVDITLAAAGTDTGPFNIYSNLDYVNPINTGVAKSALLAGYTTSTIPDGATSVRVKSNSAHCTNYVDMTITQPTVHCTFNGGYTQVFSKLTNYGAKNVVVVIRKNNNNVTASNVGANSNTNAYLSNTTWTATDELEILVNTTNGSNINIANPTILPNGSVAIGPTSTVNNNTPSVKLVFNGNGSGWGLGSTAMFYFNFSFTAS